MRYQVLVQVGSIGMPWANLTSYLVIKSRDHQSTSRLASMKHGSH